MAGIVGKRKGKAKQLLKGNLRKAGKTERKKHPPQHHQRHHQQLQNGLTKHNTQRQIPSSFAPNRPAVPNKQKSQMTSESTNKMQTNE